MKEFHILGKSEAGLSLIIDIIYSIYDKNFKIKIINNQPLKYNEELPYQIDSIEIHNIFHADWELNKDASILITTGITKTKGAIFDFFSSNYSISINNYDNIIHQSAIISETIKLSKGIIINPGVTIAPYAKLGNFVYVNRNSSIGHHTEIGDFVNINPGVTICGKIKIGNNVSIGAGATIIDHIEIGDNTIVGAGSLVTKNIPANVVAYGCPARIIKSL